MSVNLSAWAIKNRTLVRYAMLVLALVGIFSYQKLGQSEDPPFTFRVMVVQTYWPGATAAEVSQQVTDRIEKKLLETGQYEFLRSYSKPGESMLMFMAKESIRSDDVPELWYQVRKKVGDIRHTLPQGVQGPFFNDEFGDTFGNIYALSGDGFDYATLKNYAERIELELHRVPDVAKVELVGLQNEKIWINLSNTKLATLGLSMYQVQQAIDAQNAVNSSSFFETETDRVQLRVSGGFQSIDEIRNFPVRANGRNFRLGEIAEVSRGFADPALPDAPNPVRDIQAFQSELVLADLAILEKRAERLRKERKAIVVQRLPKTRSGKIMRRLLRNLAKGEEITSDLSTLENPAILEQLKEKFPKVELDYFQSNVEGEIVTRLQQAADEKLNGIIRPVALTFQCG